MLLSYPNRSLLCNIFGSFCLHSPPQFTGPRSGGLKVEITSMHSKAGQIAATLTRVSAFLKRIKATAEQLSQGLRWKLILSAAFRSFLGGKVLGSTGRLADAASDCGF